MAIQPKIFPLPSSAPDFAYEFTKRMRMRNDVTKKPSIRQTQSIPQLLSVRYFRNGRLTLEDFLDAAIYTTFPPDQAIAREVAEDILLGRENETKKSIPEKEQSAIHQTRENAALVKAVEQIRREQELAKIIEKDKVEAGYEYLLKLRKKRDKRLYVAAQDYLTDGEIVLRGITSDSELRKVASRELLDRFGGLETKDIRNSIDLSCLDDVCNSPNAAEQLAASSLRGDNDVEQRFSDLAQRDPKTAARALKHMEELDSLNYEQQISMNKILQGALNDLSEAADYADELGRVPDNLDEFIKNAPQKYSLSDAATFAQKIKDATGKDILDDIFEQYDRQFNRGADNRVDMRQLAEHARANGPWESLLQKHTQNLLHIADSRSLPSDFLRSTLARDQPLQELLPDQRTKERWDKSMNELANGAVRRSPTVQHLRQTVKHVTQIGQVPSAEVVRVVGERLGMTEEEILELINPSFEVIKQLIQAGVQDFERLHNLMSGARLSQMQLQQLGSLASKMENQSALGAVAHEDLHAALGIIEFSAHRRGYGYYQSGLPTQAYDKDRAKMTIDGLLGGPATNIIRMWYAYRDELPYELKERLRKIAKRLLIDLGLRYARQIMGSSMLGGIQESSTVRPFRIDDDIDLIDLEETIDSLLSQGRASFNIIETTDFLVTETYQGHRAFYWALDKSGSMDSPRKLGMLAISVMAGLYGVKKDDFGVVLFDSMTHVVKDISKRNISVEKVAADLLDVKASGGTGGQESIKLALRNFESTMAKEKIFIFSSDMELSDQEVCEGLVERMRPLGIKMILLVPTHEYNRDAALNLSQKAHGVVLEIDSVEELPTKLLKITNY